MNLSKIKRLLSLCVSFVLLLSFTACSSVEMPTVPDVTPYPIPQKLSVAGTYTLLLYFPSESKGGIEGESHIIYTYNDVSPLYSIISEMQREPKSDNLSAPIPESVAFLNKVEISRDSVSVFFDGNIVTKNSIGNWLTFAVCIVNTLHDFCGINSVSIFLNGQPISYNDFEVGVITYASEMRSVTESVDYGKYIVIDKTVTTLLNTGLYLYLPSGEYLYTETSKLVRDTSHTKKQVIIQILRELMETEPFAGKKLSLVNTEDQETTPTINITDSQTETDLISLSRAISITLSSFFDEIKTVNVSINGKDVKSYSRDDCAKYIGTYVPVYYQYLLNGVLTKRSLPIPQEYTPSLTSVLNYMLNKSSGMGVFLPSFSIESVLACYVSSGVAVVNLSQEFFDELDGYVNNEAALVAKDDVERLLIYSIVNTLCGYEYISSVLFLHEGKSMGMLYNMYLGTPLYKNPGLIYGE